MAKNTYRLVRDRAATGCCSACGQRVPDAGLRVDLATNTVSADGLMINVQPRTAEFVEVLLANFPHYVPREVLIAKVWANNALDRSVDAQANRARSAMAKLGYGVESTRGYGYRLAALTIVKPPVTLPEIASFSRLQYVRPY